MEGEIAEVGDKLKKSKNLIIRWLITGITIFGIAYYLPSLIKVTSITAALIASLLLAFINAFVRPVVVFITMPLKFLTLGMITFVVNALMLYLVSYLLGGSFIIMGVWQAIAAAFLISLISTFLSSFLT